MITDRVAGNVLLAPGAPAGPSSKTEPDADRLLLSVSVLAPVLMLVVKGTVEFTTNPAGWPTGTGPSTSQLRVVLLLYTQPLVAAAARATGPVPKSTELP